TISVELKNLPTNQYEQTDLVWYYDDSNMVKLGLELVDGKLSVVMGREEKDKTRTVAIIPTDSESVRLRLFVTGNRIAGLFQPPGSEGWETVGNRDLPAPPNGKPKLSLQFYQGPEIAEHWARVSYFGIRASKAARAP